MHRRRFLQNASILIGAVSTAPDLWASAPKEEKVMTVLGPIELPELGTTLIHEHLLVDFIGAADTGTHRYVEEEVLRVVLPYLEKLKAAGCHTLVDCTPPFLGRDAQLTKQLSMASGLNILISTGLYAALDGKYLPAYAHQESGSQLAERWIKEAETGIDHTNVYPGIIKIGVDQGSLLPIGKKLLKASALTHLKTGLSISGHTGDGVAAMEELDILENEGVHPSAFRWVHAQNEKDQDLYITAAQRGAYIEFDGIRPDSVDRHVELVKFMKEQGFLNQTLISQDAGWYSVGEANGGDFTPYTMIFDQVLPAFKQEGFTDSEIRQLLVTNPGDSLKIEVRKISG